MAKLYFNFSAMNAGKSTVLLQASHNYIERGMETFLLTAALDDRGFNHQSLNHGGDSGVIASRIGIEAGAETFSEGDDLKGRILDRHRVRRLACVLIDEAQFLTEGQVWSLAEVCDDYDIPVMCYGLRTDFQGRLFAGSAALLSLADDLREIRTICWCGKKAIMVLRLDEAGCPVESGVQIEIGGNDKYVSLCRRHWRGRDLGRDRDLGRGRDLAPPSE